MPQGLSSQQSLVRIDRQSISSTQGTNVCLTLADVNNTANWWSQVFCLSCLVLGKQGLSVKRIGRCRVRDCFCNKQLLACLYFQTCRAQKVGLVLDQMEIYWVVVRLFYTTERHFQTQLCLVSNTGPLRPVLQLAVTCQQPRA